MSTRVDELQEALEAIAKAIDVSTNKNGKPDHGGYAHTRALSRLAHRYHVGASKTIEHQAALVARAVLASSSGSATERRGIIEPGWKVQVGSPGAWRDAPASLFDDELAAERAVETYRADDKYDDARVIPWPPSAGAGS